MPDTTFDIEVIEAGGGEATRISDGASIYAKGDRGDVAYIVKSGRVRIGNGVPIEVLEPGEIFGETALIDEAPRSAAATAVGPTELIPIDRATFDVLIRDDCDFACTVMRLMARRLRLVIGLLEEAPAPAESHAA